MKKIKLFFLRKGEVKKGGKKEKSKKSQDDVERDRGFKRKRLYKRETEGSRKEGENKGKRAKNIPATLKGTGVLITE